jgi:division protein CdvB (Snf7/Vps24/ESCRT-III family)
MAVLGLGSATLATGKAIKVAMLNGSKGILSATKVHQTMTLTKTRVLLKNEKPKTQLTKNMRTLRTKALQMRSKMKSHILRMKSRMSMIFQA